MSRQERNCAHGVGHPLPDVHGTDSIHGCDGCCGGDPDPAATPTILDDARRIVEDSRRNEYGEPLDNWTDTAAIWTTLLRKKLLEPLTPDDALLCMIGVKLARQAFSPKRDTLVDVAGYALCIEKIQQERSRRDRVAPPKPTGG